MRTRRSPSPRKKIILSLLIVLLVVTGGFALYRIQHKADDSSDGTGSETQQQITADQTVKATQVTDSELTRLITDWAEARSANYAITIEELDNAVANNDLRTASYRGDAQMVPASTYKVFVAYAVLHEIEQGSYTLHTVTRNGQTIDTCLTAMIVESSNDCGRALGFLLGWKHINNLLAEQGMTHTDLYNYVEGNDEPVGDKHTTANDSAALLKGLYTGGLLNQDHTKLLLDLMKRQAWRERIAAGLPSGTEIASKPGWLDNIQSEIAIVYGPVSTYSISVYSTEASPAPLAELSTLVYNYFATGQDRPVAP